MEEKAPLLAVTLRKLLLAFIWASSCSAQRYQLFDIPPDTRFFVGSVHATNVAECLLAAKGFKGKLARGQLQPNVATWCSQNRRCNAYSLPASHNSMVPESPLTSFLLQNQLTRNPTTCFQTILPIRQPRMVFFWPLTQHTKGRNFGTTWPAKEADFSTSGVCRFLSVGPFPWGQNNYGGRRFCRAQGPRPPPLIALVINKRRVFDFSKDFTIAMWIKNSFRKCLGCCQNLVTGVNVSPTPDPTSFLLLRCNQLSLEFQAYSTINDEGKYNWRHIALVHQAAHGNVQESFKFYKNAKVWPRDMINWLPHVFTPSSHITLFALPNGRYPFKGDIAMVMLIQRAVPFIEMPDLMRGNV